MNETSLIIHVSRGYTRALKRLGIEDINLFAPGKRAVRLLLREEAPTWIIGDPGIRDNYCHKEYGGRMLRLHPGLNSLLSATIALRIALMTAVVVTQ